MKIDASIQKEGIDFCPLDKREENTEKIIGLLKKDMENGRAMYKRLLNYSVKIVKNYHDGEDIISQFILHLIKRGARTYEYNIDRSIDGKLTRWMYRGVRNLSISFIRNKKISSVSYFSEKENEDYRFIDKYWYKQKQEDSPNEKVSKKEEMENVSRNLSYLKPKHENILLQRYFERASYKEISETQHIPIGTVKSRLHAAKEKFAELEEIVALTY